MQVYQQKITNNKDVANHSNIGTTDKVNKANIKIDKICKSLNNRH